VKPSDGRANLPVSRDGRRMPGPQFGHPGGRASRLRPCTPKPSEDVPGASSFAGLRRTGPADGPCEPRRLTAFAHPTGCRGFRLALPSSGRASPSSSGHAGVPAAWTAATERANTQPRRRAGRRGPGSRSLAARAGGKSGLRRAGWPPTAAPSDRGKVPQKGDGFGVARPRRVGETAVQHRRRCR
jgi:hypothetical protein